MIFNLWRIMLQSCSFITTDMTRTLPVDSRYRALLKPTYLFCLLGCEVFIKKTLYMSHTHLPLSFDNPVM